MELDSEQVENFEEMDEDVHSGEEVIYFKEVKKEKLGKKEMSKLSFLIKKMILNHFKLLERNRKITNYQIRKIKKLKKNSQYLKN